MKLFDNTRIRFAELYSDALQFLKNSYGDLGQYFTMASPMGQLLQVILHYGRMILFYVEDSITELNIRTASRPNSIKGLATLTGHNPSRAMAARGTLVISHNGKKLPENTNVVIIPNYTKISNIQNGLTYTVVLPGEEAHLNLATVTNTVDLNIIQGTIEYQQATGSGDPLQSYNFQNKKGASIDNYFISIFVDGKKWEIVQSILDMPFNQEAVMVKTGQTGGIDVFFGNGYNGATPRMGSTILVEYLVTDGDEGNLDSINTNLNESWSFLSKGFSLNGEEIDLNQILTTQIKNEIMFGAPDEPLFLTRILAPKMSRSFVLANQNNYIYFLRKLNMFSIIDAIPGFATFEDQYTLDKYNQSKTIYETVNEEYRKIIAKSGVSAVQAQSKKVELDNAQQQLYYYENQLMEQKKDDNTIYLFLIPDISKRLPSDQNYYTCNIETFRLSENEKVNILDLIEQSGQRILTVDNQILDLQYPRFTINMSLILWEGTSYDTVRENIVAKTAKYFTQTTRRDRIPVSDLIKIIEDIDGIDSVNVWFDADKNNLKIYKTHYGVDDYGDILLERSVKDAFGNNVGIKDLYPVIRGGFENEYGTYYEDSLVKNKLSSLNIQVRGYTTKNLNSDINTTVVSNI